MKTIQLNDQSFLVDQRLAEYQIFQKASSNVDFFGTYRAENKLFVQFKGGSGAYIYSDVPESVLTAAENATSIGRFIASDIIGKFVSEKYEERLVKPAQTAVPASDPEF